MQAVIEIEIFSLVSTRQRFLGRNGPLVKRQMALRPRRRVRVPDQQCEAGAVAKSRIVSAFAAPLNQRNSGIFD